MKKAADGWRSVSGGGSPDNNQNMPLVVLTLPQGAEKCKEEPMTVFEKIEAQQKKETGRTDAWMAGEQLKDICRMEPRSAELIDKDLDVPEMSIKAAAAKIKAYADSHRTGSFACVTPAEADRILREFYGLSGQERRREAARGSVIDLADFL